MSAQLDAVRRYYDHNLAAFQRQSGRQAVMHRALWPPGVTDRDQALRWADTELARRMEDLPRGAKVLDLGCGVGGTAEWIVRQSSLQVTGITVSPRQATAATRRLQAAGVADRCQVQVGDYHDLGALAPTGAFHAAYAIESFVHAVAPERMLAEAARALRPGGRLYLIDDFLIDPAPHDSGPASRRWLNRFVQGWHLHALLPAPAVLQLAERCGLVLENQADLTEWHRFKPDSVLALQGALALLPGRSPRVASWFGGAAVQVCLRRGWVQHLLIELRRA